MDDLISRQQAIDAFNTNIDELVVAGKENADAVERYLNRVIDEIKQLPPIQPEIVRCKDCKHFKQVFAPNDNDGLCGHWHSKCDARTNRDGYCSHAERREVTT